MVRIDTRRTTAIFLFVTVTCLMAGCGPADKPAKTQTVSEPVDVRSEVIILQGLHDTIRATFTGESVEDGHDELHEVAVVLNKLMKVDELSGITDTDASKIRQAADEMMDAFGELDAAIHEERTVDYAAVADKLEDCMTRLKAAAEAFEGEGLSGASEEGSDDSGQAPADAEDHDHADHDHADSP